MIDPKVFVKANIHQTIVTTPAIGIDDTQRISFASDNRLQRALRSIRNNLGVNLITGGFNYSEERTDTMRIWVARKQQADPEGTYARLQVDARSLRAAIVRDGHQDGGDYSVPDAGDGVRIQREAGKEYAVLQFTIPVNYEAGL